MPRSHLKTHRWHALVALLAFAVFVSLMLADAGAQGTRTRGRSQLQQNSAPSASPQQSRRKSIASVRSVDTADGSRVTITSDVPLNDYAAYWSGQRYYVVIPDADLITRDVQTLQSSLRGQGFQDVQIEKRGSDVVISFRLPGGMRARVEQKFNRLDVLFTTPYGGTFNRNQNTNVPRIYPRGGGNTSNQQSNTSVTYSTGTSTRNGSTGTSTTGATTSTGGAPGRVGRSRGGARANSGYSGGGGDRSGGAPLNIPLPSAIQTPEATPEASTSASPTASPATGEGTAQTAATPLSSASPTPPEQIAQNEPQQPVTAPPAGTSTTTTTNAPATTETSFGAAVQENWLPLLIGLLVLLAIGLLLVSRSRAGGEERATERIETKKLETVKEKPASRTGAALAGAAAGAATAAAITKERDKPAPVKEAQEEEAKEIEPVVPTVGIERVSTEAKNLLEGKDYDEAVIGSSNPETRQIVSTELMAALASRNPERQSRAREAFTKHGFFDEATKKLRTGDAPAERISAARALGLTQERSATPHLTAALEDSDPEVRRAAVNALAELRDPTAIGPLNALLEREKNRKVPHSLIRRAIESSATIDIADTPATSAAAPSATAEATDATATAADKKDKDDEDREVFEI